MSHNSKYYGKSIKTNKVKSKNIVTLFKKNEEANNISSGSNLVEVCVDHMNNDELLEQPSVTSESI